MIRGAYLLFLLLLATQCMSSEIRWDHSVDLDENFRFLWKVKMPDIIIEVQVKTHGYIGFGFARSEHIYGADMVVGWVDNKHTFFQVSFVIQNFVIEDSVQTNFIRKIPCSESGVIFYLKSISTFF